MYRISKLSAFAIIALIIQNRECKKHNNCQSINISGTGNNREDKDLKNKSFFI